MSKYKDHDFANNLINGLFPQRLSDFFQKRIKELDITPTTALDIIDIEYRALQGILNGTSKRVDYTNFNKLANFLQITRDTALNLYFDELERNFPESAPYPQEKIDFINRNFDLAALKKAGFINSIIDYKHIERRINYRFGFKSIFEYQPEKRGVAFSAGAIEPINKNSRLLWLEDSIKFFEELSNPYEYDKEQLIKYIPLIRTQSKDVKNGLRNVIRDLYKVGVTVVYQSGFSNLHLRGATLLVKDKPCIVLTDYKGFYPTLWFGLMHEISHVLFDLKFIKENSYHITDQGPNEEGLDDIENHANKFARDYLFSAAKAEAVRPHINNKIFVEEFADQNGIDKSFIYVFHAFYADKDDTKAWPRAQNNNPEFTSLTNELDLKWTDDRSISDHIRHLKTIKIYS